MDRLAELRERRALTLRELSEMGGVAADTINQIELGHRKARPSTLRKLAKALDVDVRDLFEEPALSGKAEGPPSLDATDEEFDRMVTEADENQLGEMKRDLSGHLPKGGSLPLPQPTRRELLAMDRSIAIYQEQKRRAAAGEEYLQELAAAMSA